MNRFAKKLAPARVRELKELAQRIDRDEAESIKGKGRAVKARHDQLHEVAKVLKAERERLGSR